MIFIALVVHAWVTIEDLEEAFCQYRCQIFGGERIMKTGVIEMQQNLASCTPGLISVEPVTDPGMQSS